MRFVIFIGLTMIAKTIDKDVVMESSGFYTFIAILALVWDILEFAGKENKK